MAIKEGWLMTMNLKAGISGYEMEPTVSVVQWTGARVGNDLHSLVHGKLGVDNFLLFKVQRRGKLQ